MTLNKIINEIKKPQARLLSLALIGSIIQFIVFKLLYPYPDFCLDSYYYLYAASTQASVGFLPIGYSLFLSLFHYFSESDTALIAFQYLFYQGSAICLFVTVVKFYRPGIFIKATLYIFLLFNPLFLYISNYISNDWATLTLSILWFSQLIWLIHRPNPLHIITHSILLLLLFIFTLSFYIYLVVSLVACLFVYKKPLVKVVAISLPFVLIIPFLLYQRNNAKNATGHAQDTYITGWQWANNALTMRAHIYIDSRQFPSQESKQLDFIVKGFYKHIKLDLLDEYLSQYEGSYFIIDARAPLTEYLAKNYPLNEAIERATAIGKAAPVFEEYGQWLIRNYPVSFAQYFIIPNIRRYFIPPLEHLEKYNNGENITFLIAQNWFAYQTPTITSISKTAQGNILFPIPYLFIILHVLFWGTIIWWLFRRKTLDNSPEVIKLILLSLFYILANFCSAVVSRPIVLREHIFPMLVSLLITLLLIELLDKKELAFDRKNGLSLANRPILKNNIL